VLLPKVLILLPYLAGFPIVWSAAWPYVRLPAGRVPAALPGESEAAALPPPRREWTLARYLVFQFRQQLLLFLLPMLAAILISDTFGLVRRRWGGDWPILHTIAPVMMFAPMATVLLVLGPQLLIRIVPTRPLRDGPLRDRLLTLARRVGFRCRSVRVWMSDSAIINACIVGVVPRYRHVLLSDGLLMALSPRQVESVFAHEVGHSRHHHIVFLVAGVLAAVLMPTGLPAALDEAWPDLLPDAELPGWLDPLLSGVLALWATAFLSQRFERQADLFAARSLCDPKTGCIGAEPIFDAPLFVPRPAPVPAPVMLPAGSTLFSAQADGAGASGESGATGGSPASADASSAGGPAAPAGLPVKSNENEVPGPVPCPVHRPGALCPVAAVLFSSSLDRVTAISGVPRTSWSWLHGSVAGRIDFLLSLPTDPDRERRFQLRLMLYRGLALAAGVAAVVWLCIAAAEALAG
jgi:Zn-dependent protease with chaperone function